MEKVGDGFGGPLQEELINRLEQTIADFHEEVSEMMASLKENAEKRHEKLKEIWNNPDASFVETDNQKTDIVKAQPETEMSEWERRLEEAGKLGDSDSSSTKSNEPVKEQLPKRKDYLGARKSRYKLRGEISSPKIKYPSFLCSFYLQAQTSKKNIVEYLNLKKEFTTLPNRFRDF